MTDGLSALVQALDDAVAQDNPVTFWWRDDDLCRPTPASESLLTLAEETGVALALSVIPRFADDQLVTELAGTTHQVWQHGYDHTNHGGQDPAGAGFNELGDNRNTSTVMAELAEGWRQMEHLFGERSAPVLVPPYGRVGSQAAARLDSAGYIAVSLHGASGALIDTPLPALNTHVDVLHWSSPPQSRPRELLLQELADATNDATRSLASTPVGILTHHLDLPKESWAFMREIIRLICEHPGSRWVTPQQLIASLPEHEAV